MLQRAMAAEAEASREARAKVMKTDAFLFVDPMSLYLKVIAADGEMRASKALREASQIIEQSPAALQLRYLQVFNSLHFRCKCLKVHGIYNIQDTYCERNISFRR